MNTPATPFAPEVQVRISHQALHSDCTAPRVEKTFFAGTRMPAGQLTLVQCTDGTVALHLDGRPYGEHRWPLAELERGVEAYRQVSAELKRQTQRAEEAPPAEPPSPPVLGSAPCHHDAA